MSQIKTETECPKEAALLALLRKFQEIDTDSGSRGAYGASIVMNQMNGLDKPIFDQEIALIKAALGISESCPIPSIPEPERPAISNPGFVLGDL